MQNFIEFYSNSPPNSHQHSKNADEIANMKSKITVSRQHFFADMIFSAISNIPNYQNKAYQGILNIFSNILALFFIFSKL